MIQCYESERLVPLSYFENQEGNQGIFHQQVYFSLVFKIALLIVIAHLNIYETRVIIQSLWQGLLEMQQN